MAETTGRELVQAAASYANGGLAVAYLMAVLNAGLGCLVAFGVVLSTAQQAAVIAFGNTAIVATFHLLAMFKRGNRFGPPAHAHEVPDAPPEVAS